MGRIETTLLPEDVKRIMAKKPESVEENLTTTMIIKQVGRIIDRLGMLNESMSDRLSPILTPELPSCPSTEIDDLSQGSQFFGELLQRIKVIDDRINDIETTVNRIEV